MRSDKLSSKKKKNKIAPIRNYEVFNKFHCFIIYVNKTIFKYFCLVQLNQKSLKFKAQYVKKIFLLKISARIKKIYK